jgi:CHAT domain-containing protein
MAAILNGQNFPPTLSSSRFATVGSCSRAVLALSLVVLLWGIGVWETPVWAQVGEPTPHSVLREDGSEAFFSENGAIATPEQLAWEGQQRYDARAFGDAAQLWQQAADAYAEAGNRTGTQQSLVNRSQALQNLGMYPQACASLLQAFQIDGADCRGEALDRTVRQLVERKEPTTPLEVVGLQSLGSVLLRQGFLDPAAAVLQLALTEAAGLPEEGATLLSWGNVEQERGNRIRDRWTYDEMAEILDRQSVSSALAPYQPALKGYRQASAAIAVPLETRVQAQLNQLSLLLDIRQWWIERTDRYLASWTRQGETDWVQHAQTFLTQLRQRLEGETESLYSQIRTELPDLPLARSAVEARLHLVGALRPMQQIEAAEPLLNEALSLSRRLRDRRSEAYALGYLGRLYGERGELEPATQLTRQALFLTQAPESDSREIAYLWQAQLGRLLVRQGDEAGAIAAYGSAFNTLQSLRADLQAVARDVQFDFRQEVKPVYRELADLLLRSTLSDAELDALFAFPASASFSPSLLAADQPSPPAIQSSPPPEPSHRLELARRTIEALQLAELDNFFQDPCSAETERVVQLDDLDPRAAVVYPIILPDRLEVIVSLPHHPLRSHAIPVDEQTVTTTLDTLYDALDNGAVDSSARNIFSTSNPSTEEVKASVQTLLPLLGQLYDWLIRPFESDLAENRIETLVFVLNDRLQRVPMAALYDGQQYLIEHYGIALAPSLQLVDPQPLPSTSLKVLAAGLSEAATVRDTVFPALANVPQELAQIEADFPDSRTLLDRDFTAAIVEERLQRSPFPIVHLATHGVFSSNPNDTFIVTGQNGSIDLTQLGHWLTAGGQRLDLLVLSACQTATGDERAVLGLAGIAVRSGAHSTLATLWPVGDASTTQLMRDFYRTLKQPQKTKVAALSQAQRSLLAYLKTHPPIQELKDLPPHPYYWSPYILVGNWL